MEKITVIGAGYVGLTSAVLLANCGYRVTLLEINKQRLDSVKSGRSFFYEHGVDELLQSALNTKKLTPTDSAAHAFRSADIVFSCVGTPDNPDGSSNLSYVFGVAKEAIKYAKDGLVFVQKSTVPVGTGKKIEKLFKANSRKFTYVSNPEFLREGTAIQDSLFFDRVVAGSSNKPAATRVLDIYKTLDEKCLELAKIVKVDANIKNGGSYIQTDLNSAELIKVTANAFLALKISFANSIAKLADHAGANVNDVMDAVGADKRIGREFLNAGRGYGGGCFPKDVSGLISSAAEYSVDMPIMTAATEVNDSMPGYIANRAQEILGTLQDKKIAVLGLSFKAGTSDARKSPGVKMANLLSKAGAVVSAYDPHANGEAKEDLRDNIRVCQSALEAADGADAIFITTAWPEFREMDMHQLKSVMSGILIYDADNALDRSEVEKEGLRFVGVGIQ